MLWALSRDRLTARQRARYDRLGLCSPRETSKATCEGYVNWPPFRPDTRHNLEGLRLSSSTGLCLTTTNVSN